MMLNFKKSTHATIMIVLSFVFIVSAMFSEDPIHMMIAIMYAVWSAEYRLSDEIDELKEKIK